MNIRVPSAVLLSLAGVMHSPRAETTCGDKWFPGDSMSTERSLSYKSPTLPRDYWNKEAERLRCVFQTQLRALEESPLWGACSSVNASRILIQIDRANSAMIRFSYSKRMLDVVYAHATGELATDAVLYRKTVRLDEERSARLNALFGSLALVGGSQGLRPNPYFEGATSTHTYYWLGEACDGGKYGYALFEAPVAGVGGRDAVGLLDIAALGFRWARPTGLPRGAPLALPVP